MGRQSSEWQDNFVFTTYRYNLGNSDYWARADINNFVQTLGTTVTKAAPVTTQGSYFYYLKKVHSLGNDAYILRMYALIF